MAVPMLDSSPSSEADPGGTLLLTRSEIARLLSMTDCIAAVEEALRLHAAGHSLPPAVLGVHAKSGGFHVKAAGLLLDRPYFAAKINANFPGNPQRFGLPTIQGVGAAGGRRVRHAARAAGLDRDHRQAHRGGNRHRRQASRAGGRQHNDLVRLRRAGAGPARGPATRTPPPAHPCPRSRSGARFAAEQAPALGIEIVATHDLGSAIGASDVVVTCTPARIPFLKRAWIRPGAFIAAVGADAPEKRKLEPELLTAGGLVVDHLEQCATLGELHHALDAGLTTRDAVRAELHELVARAKPGRRSADEITIFDSTGTALQDVAAAVAAHRAARASGTGRRLDFAGCGISPQAPP
jgi:alanine dehydrogenase